MESVAISETQDNKLLLTIDGKSCELYPVEIWNKLLSVDLFRLWYASPLRDMG